MTEKLRISPDLALPAAAVTSTDVVYGGKGMGKTNFGSVYVEELTKANLRWSVLDPMGVWWGLRYAKDGKGPSGVRCLLLGGAHGDIPIEPTAGAVVADLVIDEAVNTIIDFSRHSNGKMWSAGERVRFVTEYAVRLFERQGELVDGRRREPMKQIIDEAARYIPQTIPSGAIDLAKCVGAWEQICEEGRNIGLGVTFLTQRSARMNKSVSELADVMIAFRTIGPNSLAAIMDWLGEHVEKSRVREISAQVRSLDVGEALVVSPGWLGVEKVVKIRERETFDSSATPKPGERARRVTGHAAQPDLAAYQARMAATIERAKLDDPKALRAKIRELETQLKKAPARVTEKAVVDQAAIERAIVAERKRMSSSLRRLRARLGSINAAMAALPDMLDTAIADVDLAIESNAASTGESRAVVQVGHMKKETTGANRPPVSTAGRSSRAPASPVVTSTSKDDTLPAGERAILTAIAQYPDGASRDQLSVLAGYKRSSRDTYIQRLQARGYVETRGTIIVATDDGIDALGPDFEPLPVGEDLQAYWLDRLPAGERAILEILIGAGGNAVHRDSLSEATGYKRSSRDTYLQRLSARKLVIPMAGGHVAASSTLFTED